MVTPGSAATTKAVATIAIPTATAWPDPAPSSPAAGRACTRRQKSARPRKMAARSPPAGMLATVLGMAKPKKATAIAATVHRRATSSHERPTASTKYTSRTSWSTAPACAGSNGVCTENQPCAPLEMALVMADG